MNNQNPFNQRADLDKLETVICFESLLDTCYQALAGLVDNEHIRKECRRFERNAQYHQKELRRFFPLAQENETAIENKLYQYLLQLRPPCLFLRALINLAINLTANKIDIYRYFSLKRRGHRKLLRQFIDDSKEEMGFLCRGRDFYHFLPGGSYEKTILGPDRNEWGLIGRTADREFSGLCR